ncbi:MAG TPA: helix-turn-helix transcriptional regulator [Candidatus Dojkabacteria bacterium]|nr:helix-turn-helix transcriptional regulator [Candidatus Dojkabacteria bacterium]
MKAIGLAKNMQILRKDKGLTQEELAKESGIAYTTIVKLEQGLLDNPTLKTLQKLADVFKISIDELIKIK